MIQVNLLKMHKDTCEVHFSTTSYGVYKKVGNILLLVSRSMHSIVVVVALEKWEIHWYNQEYKWARSYTSL